LIGGSCAIANIRVLPRKIELRGLNGRAAYGDGLDLVDELRGNDIKVNLLTARAGPAEDGRCIGGYEPPAEDQYQGSL
jgi:hypothetical protein